MEKNLKLEDSKEEIRLICDALSNIRRLKLIELIKETGELSHRTLAEEIGVRSSSITYNLTPLLDAGIIEERVEKGLKGRNKKTPYLKINKIVIEL